MPSEERTKKIKNVVNNRQKGIVVVLEDVHDPHNAAAILRSCDAFGVQRVCFVFEKRRPYNPRKVGKTSSSANKWLDLEIFSSAGDCLTQLKAEGYELIATALTEGAENLYQADLISRKMAILVGNEHAGLSGEAIKMADRVIRLPMRGMVQSLNVSVMAAVFLYELTRQRMKQMKKYLLAAAERRRLISDFEKR